MAKAEPMAGITIFGSSIAETGIRLFIFCKTSMDVTPKIGFDQNRALAVIARCSTIGPSASAGKKV
ncbi:MAG: hypothetical protein WA303_03640, partial [Bradyrhizobium sp.]